MQRKRELAAFPVALERDVVLRHHRLQLAPDVVGQVDRFAGLDGVERLQDDQVVLEKEMIKD